MDRIGDVTICTIVYTTRVSAHSHDDLQLDDLSNIVCGYQLFTSITDNNANAHVHVYVCVHVDGGVDVHVLVHVDTDRGVDNMQIQAHHTIAGPSLPQSTLTPVSYTLYAIFYILHPV